MLDVGARFSGHASRSTPAYNKQSLFLARVEFLFPVMEIRGIASLLMTGKMEIISDVSPLFDNATTTSFLVSIPKSPCTPSAGCIKREGVPVEESVAAIFLPIIPDFPIPVITVLPLQL